MINAGANWYDPDVGNPIRQSMARESAAWGRWQRAAKRLGLRGYALTRKIGPEPPRFIEPGGEEDGLVWLPRYAPGTSWAPSSGSVPTAETIPFSGTLRPYQAAAVEAWRANRGNGTIVAPCGAGKTVLFCCIAGATPTPALVLVHTKDLLEQWLERIETYLPGCTIGRLGGGKAEKQGRIVIATIQTLERMAPEKLVDWSSRFGLVGVDEAHHAPAATWSWVLAHCPGRYRVALTATPDRADGLGEWVCWSCGPIVAAIKQCDVEAVGAVLVPVIRRIRTGWDWVEENERWDVVMRALCSDAARNAIIQEELTDQITRGRITLALTGAIEHADLLADLCGGVSLSSQTGVRLRRETLEAMRAGSIRLLVATQLADEGLDMPSIDTVALCYPDKDPNHAEQRIGRSLRPAPGKTAEVLDFRDDWKPLMGWGMKRDRLYRKKGWETP